MKILIDDERTMIFRYIVPDITATNYEAGLALINMLIGKQWLYEEAEIYLDHDLGSIELKDDGHAIMSYIEELYHTTQLKPKKIVCVSGNPQGAGRIEAAVRKMYGRTFPK